MVPPLPSTESLEALPAPVIVLDRLGRIVHWNGACAASVAIPLEELRGRPFAELATSAEERSAIERAIAEIAPDRPVRVVLHLGGREARSFAWTCAGVAADGELDRIVAVGVETTEIDRERAADRHRMRALLEHAPEAIFVADVHGRYTDVNAAGCQLVGRSRDDLLGKTVVDLLPPDDLPRLAATRERLLAGESHLGEWTLRHADGSDVPVELTARILPDGQWLAFARAIRERRAHEAERERLLREAEIDRRRLRAMLDTVPAGVLVIERDGEIVFNHRAEELFGSALRPDAGVAQYASRVLFPDGSPVPRDQLLSSRVLREGVPVRGVEFRIERPDGTRVPVLGSAAPIHGADGTVSGAVGVFLDVSERLASQTAIRANERLLEAIFELLPVGVWIADRDGRIVRGNPAGLRIWAGARYVGPSEFHEYKAWWADTGEPIAPDEWALARALRKGETSIGELIRIQCFDGSQKTIINSAMPLTDEWGQFAGAIVVNQDISELRAIEDALRRAVLARDEVLGVVAHDLRSPLNAIVLQLHALLRTVDRDPRLVRALELIQRQTTRMNALIQDLLEVARVDAGALTLERARVSAGALVDEVAEALRGSAAKSSLELRVEIARDLPPLEADGHRLARVLDNLVSNAIKSTRPGGHVTIGAAPGDHEVVFRVEDTGVGIPETSMRHLFDRFWQQEPGDRRGIGLGLPIAKGIVEAHGGRMWVESRVGVGTTFWFTVPTARR